MRLTENQRRSFVRDGYLVVPDVVSAQLRGPALRAINAALGSGSERVANYVFSGLQVVAVLIETLVEGGSLVAGLQARMPCARIGHAVSLALQSARMSVPSNLPLSAR
jgi:predicted DNA repair protein MutK